MRAELKAPSGPRYEILPAVGSVRAPHPEGADCHWCNCQFWWKVRRKHCVYCDAELGTECWWIVIWRDVDQVAHMPCQDEFLELERWWLTTQSVVEAAAKKHNLTPLNILEGMTSWDRDRILREELDQIFPEWRLRVQEKLRENRGISK